MHTQSYVRSRRIHHLFITSLIHLMEALRVENDLTLCRTAVVNAAGFRRRWTNRARRRCPTLFYVPSAIRGWNAPSLCSAQPRRIIAFARIACNLVMNTYVPRTWSGGSLICRRVTSGGLWNAGTAERTACSWTLRPTRVMSPDSISGSSARYNCDTKAPAQTLETRKSHAFPARIVTQNAYAIENDVW